MGKQDFYKVLQQEVARIDETKTSKRQEKVIEGFTNDPCPQAMINGKPVRIFNSNDYLGLRFHPEVKRAEHEASEKYGAGPGAVRFISGSLKIHKELEDALAKFHAREAGMIFSSAFAANLAVLFCLAKGQSKDSVVSGNVLIISDELNHRSIIDGIRLSNLSSEQKAIFKHMDAEDLKRVLTENKGKYDRVLVVTDGVFSMLGEFQSLKAVRDAVDQFDGEYKEGVMLIVDDCHGVGIAGKTGRGVEEVEGVHSDVLVGTMGKGFGSDGGYIVADQVVIDYLRESSATYIYSNNISPGTAGAALAAVTLVDESEGKNLLANSAKNVEQFKTMMKTAGFVFAAESSHAIQPVLIADAVKTKALTDKLLDSGFLVTNINYPVVPKGKDEIRVQLSALHTDEDIKLFVEATTRIGKELGII